MGATENNVRDRILDAAVGVLENAGIKKFAQPHIARLAGIPQGHLTYYFPKRKDLLSAALGRFVTLLREDLPEGLRNEARGRAQGARAYVVRVASQVVKNRARMRMLLGLVVAAEEDPKLARDMVETVDVVRRVLRRFLGSKIPDDDVELVLASLWGIGLLHLVQEERTDEETDRLLERLEASMARLAPPPSTPPAPRRPRASKTASTTERKTKREPKI